MKYQSFDLPIENIYICEVIASLTGFTLCKTKLQENVGKTLIKVSSSLIIAKQNPIEKQKTFWLQKYIIFGSLKMIQKARKMCS